MNSIFTPVFAAKISRHSLRKAFILSVIIIFLPGCINKAGRADSAPNAVISVSHHANAIAITTDTDSNYHTESITDATNDTTPTAGIPNMTSLPGLLPTIDNGHHFDPHSNEEGHVMNVAFPRLMRIAIMLLLTVLII
jgi:hypothetical protein